jgi:hypothetical protein
LSLLVLVLLALLSYPLGMALGQPWLLPLLNAAPAYVVMASRLRRGDRRGAAVAMLAWALALAVAGTLAFSLWPTPPDGLVLHGPAYRDEMLHWIRTGEGAEGSPRLFLVQHLIHLVAFVALSLATASTLSLFMGAVLMNYMSFYVASLGRAGVPVWAVAAMGWHPWAVCRVAAFCLLGVALAEPLLSRVLRYPYPGLRASRTLFRLAAAGLLADVVLKAALAPAWGRVFRSLLH